MKTRSSLLFRFAFRIAFALAILALHSMPAGLFAQSNPKQDLEIARQLLESYKYNQAIDICSKVIFKDDRIIEAYVIRAAAYCWTGKFDEGLNDLDYAIASKTKDPLAYMTRGAILQAEGHLPKALEDLKYAVSLNPKLGLAHSYYGQALLAAGDAEGALKHLDEGIRLSPEKGDPYYYKGNYYFFAQEYRLCIEMMQKALARNPKRPADIHSIVGSCQILLGKPDDARKSFMEVTKDSLTGSEGWHSLAEMEFDSGRYDEAILYLNKAIRISRIGTSKYRKAKSDCLFHLEKYEEAIAEIDTVLSFRITPTCESYALRGKYKFYLRRYQAAIEDFTLAILLDPDGCGVWTLRGKARNQLKQYDKAIEDFNRALKMDPDNGDARFGLGISYLDGGNYTLAEMVWRDYSANHPTLTSAWYNLGQSLRLQGRYKEAIAPYNTALHMTKVDSFNNLMQLVECYTMVGQMDSANADLDLMAKTADRNELRDMNNVGWAMNTLERYAEAIPYFDYSINHDPQYPYAWNNRGFAKLKLGQNEAAIKDFDMAISLKNDYKHMPYYNRANAHREKGRLQEALADFDQAIGLNPKYHEAFNDRAETWEKLNQPEKARADFEAALQIKPDYEPSKRGLERLGQ